MTEEKNKNENLVSMTNQLVATIHTLHVKLHQYHWYVKGPNFFALHEKFEELYNDNEKWFDAIAERLLASGNQPLSTTKDFLEHTVLNEETSDKELPAEKMTENLIKDYQTTKKLTLDAIKGAQEAEDVVLEDLLIGYTEHLDLAVWMLQAFLGNEAK